MLADVSVHEPKQPVDEDTPFSFSMEGSNGKQPGALIPFVWAPGWNSNQSVHKFQSEAGGALAGGTPGQRLFDDLSSVSSVQEYAIPPSTKTKEGQWQLIPLYRIFGSDELSARSQAISELTPNPFVEIAVSDAKILNVADGDGVVLNSADGELSLEVKVNASIPSGCAGYSIGLPEAKWITPNSTVTLEKDSTWFNNTATTTSVTITTEPGGPNV